MSKRKINSRALRQLAEEFFERVAGEDEFRQAERADFVTSLVRQWITYDGHAAFFVGDRQLYLDLGRTPLARPVVVPEPGLSGWTRQLIQDWKIAPDDIPALFDQLNVGQSAEAVDREGVALRLWVNPRERSRGVDPQGTEARPAVARDHRKIATDSLIQHFGGELGPEETDELARSVASQWQRFDGHASLFIDGRTELHFRIAERAGGGCEVVTSEIRISLDAALSACGFTADVFPDVVARINLGQQIEFRDRQGIRTRMWHDPKARRICHRPLDPVPPHVSPPPFCPKCTAVLLPWRDGERQQTCPLCGHTVSAG